MLFTSVSFYFYFLPIFLILFRLVSKTNRFTFLAKIVLVIGTYIFYGAANTAFLIPFIFATVCDLCWSLLLARSTRPSVRRWIVTASVVQNLSMFFIFKYLNATAAFFPHCESLQILQHAFADSDGIIPLPPGISFYLFESLSYVIDCYREKIRAPKNPFNFLVFISMFPRFIAGPIVRYADLEDSILNYKGVRFADGIFLFMIGFILKILFADSLAFFANAFFGISFGFWPSWMAVITYTLQLYIDFSAYSLMAIGLGLTLGFPFLDNFREPYHARSITEFWRRWHISLSTWLRDYLYIPLGGSRSGPFRTQLNLFLTMLIGGIWHGASLQFVFWGAYHGALLIAERSLKKFGYEVNSRLTPVSLVMFGWIFFRASSMNQAFQTIRGMVGIHGWGEVDLREQTTHNAFFLTMSVLGIVWVIWLEPWIRRSRHGLPWHAFHFENARRQSSA